MNMAQHGFFQYLRLKLIVTLLRMAIKFADRGRRRRDASMLLSAKRERVRIPSRDANRYILADLHYPPDYDPKTSESPSPILVNWHGSGFIIPSFGNDAVFCAHIARHAGVIVLDADYRKAPETPFPGAVYDVEDVLRWVATQDHRFDRSRVAVSGCSAGGTLATVAATTLRKKLHDLINIPAVFAFYPVTNLAIAPEAKQVPHPIRPFPLSLLHLFNECYVPDESTRTDPAVSPYFTDPADYPSTTVIVTCEGDIFRPEAEALAEKVLQSGDPKKNVVIRMVEGVRHGFDKGCEEGTTEWTKREETYALVVRLLKDSFGL